MCFDVDFFYGGTETFLKEGIGQLMETLEVGSTETTNFGTKVLV